MKIIVGYSGFVGGNICSQVKFDGLYDHTNVMEAYETNPDLLIYCGVPAAKFLANTNPAKDYEIIEEAMNNIREIAPKKIVLISTVDVYKDSNNKDEDSKMDTNDLHAYGLNRLKLEEWVEENYENSLIVRLPALFAKGLKKNFFYDILNPIPKMLNEEKFNELIAKNTELKDFYILQDNGFYGIKSDFDSKKLKSILDDVNFSTLTFTDSNASFQCYSLNHLWNHISIALENNLRKLNLATEPLKAKEIYYYLFNKEFDNVLSDSPANYNFKTKHCELFNGQNGYILNKEQCLKEIKAFIQSNGEK